MRFCELRSICEQRAKCPIVLYVKESIKGFIIQLFLPLSLGPYFVSLSVCIFALFYSVIAWHSVAFFRPNMVKWRNSGIINLCIHSYASQNRSNFFLLPLLPFFEAILLPLLSVLHILSSG